MKAEIISIGDELLIGQVVNTNSVFIAQQLTALGFDVHWITTVGDQPDRIFEAIRLADQRADVIIATGGLGPTHDDISKEVFARYFKSNLILDEKILQKLQERFSRRRVRMAEPNRGQAMVPDNAIIIENKIGTAPGILFQTEGRYFFVLPGVPSEMMVMMESYVAPFLKNKTTRIIKQRVLHTTGIPESTIFEQLGDIEKLEKLTKIAFLPTYSGVNIRLTAHGPTESFCNERIQKVEAIFWEKFSQHIWGVDKDVLEEIVARLLISQNKTISVVEYGTMGNVSAQLSQSADRNKFLVYGLNIGSFTACEKILGLPEKFFQQEAIVSENVSKKLAAQLKQVSGASLALAITHDDQLEVTTYMALCDAFQITTHEFTFKFEHATNIQRMTAVILKLLYQYLLKEKSS